jgi:threonine/homoserine/homoserine lactone efflux protein
MAIVYNFLIGFTASFIGVLHPGLLNMTAAKISIKETSKKAVLFSAGVCVTVLFQTYISLLFAQYLDSNPQVVAVLKKVALGIFVCITIYYFFIAKDTRNELPENENHSKTNRFFAGVFLSALNLFPLPYWVYIGVTFSAFGWLTLSHPAIFGVVVGSAAGTFTILLLYIKFFIKMKDKKFLKINLNYVIGAITGIIAIFTLLKILKDL